MQDDERRDEELVAASAAGDNTAFAALVRRHIRSATLLAAQLLGDSDDAEDVVQVAFTIVYQRAAVFQTDRAFLPWLFGIVRRLAFNRKARDARRWRLLRNWGNDAADDLQNDDAATMIGVKIDAEAVKAGMELLPPMQRACFELVVLKGIPTSEAAAMHDISESTVRQHVFRARRALRIYV